MENRRVFRRLAGVAVILLSRDGEAQTAFFADVGDQKVESYVKRSAITDVSNSEVESWGQSGWQPVQ